jgi:aminoglycoside phosphotransferase (APT) family kinase protein
MPIAMVVNELASLGTGSTLACGIAAALGAIHSVPVDTARAAGVREGNPPTEGAYEWFRRGLVGASQLIDLDATVRDAVRWASELEDPLRFQVGPTRFTHNAVGADHLVVERSTGRLVGIVDWTFTALGDAVGDFVACATLGGWGFVDQVLAHYPCAVDDGFHERLRYAARVKSLVLLGHAQQNGDDVRNLIIGVKNAFAADSDF